MRRGAAGYTPPYVIRAEGAKKGGAELSDVPEGRNPRSPCRPPRATATKTRRRGLSSLIRETAPFTAVKWRGLIPAGVPELAPPYILF